MESLKNLSDDLLIEAFMKAIDLELDKDFCDLMESEILNRDLMIPYQKKSQA